MIAALTLSFFLSVDSLIGSMISATLGMPRSAMRAMIILFATCDGLATAGGQFLAPSWVHTGVLGKGEAAILFVYAALVIGILRLHEGGRAVKTEHQVVLCTPTRV
jgi:hypothetical protein